MTQRPIKFRAWDTTRKQMETPGYWGDYINFDGDYFQKAARTYDTPNIEIEPGVEVVLMQFTGLQDKNNRDLYEGDIVEVWYGDQKDPRTENPWNCEVKWQHGGFVIANGLFTLHLAEARIEGSQIKDWMWHEPGHNVIRESWGIAHSVAVLGNIHEHPDLLKQ